MGVTKKGKPCKKKVKNGGYCNLHITQEHKNTKECNISSSESLPSPKKEKISKEEIEECKICYESLYEKGEIFVKRQTCCGKYVHKLCLERWYKIKENCPFCRAKGANLYIGRKDIEMTPMEFVQSMFQRILNIDLNILYSSSQDISPIHSSTNATYNQYIDQWTDVYPSYEEFLDHLDQNMDQIETYDEYNDLIEQYEDQRSSDSDSEYQPQEEN